MAKGKYEYWLTVEGLTLIEGWARDGLTDEQIAFNMGIGTSTLYKYKNEFIEIVEALKKGKEVIDRQVENALLKRALGYKYEEVTEEESEQGTKRKVTIKEVVPDTTAQIFWLKNRKPAEWRDKQEINHSGETTHNINSTNDISKLSVEELKQLESILRKTSDTETD